MGLNIAGICIFKENYSNKKITFQEVKKTLYDTGFLYNMTYSKAYFMREIQMENALMHYFGEEPDEADEVIELSRFDKALTEAKAYLKENYGIRIKEKPVYDVRSSSLFVCVASEYFGFESLAEYTKEISMCFPENTVFSYALRDGSDLLILLAQNGEIRYEKTPEYRMDYMAAFSTLRETFHVKSNVMQLEDDPVDFLSEIEKLLKISVFN